MQKSDPLQPDDCKLCYSFFMCTIKVSRFVFSFATNVINAKKVKYLLLFLSGKKAIYHMNGVRVLTVIISAMLTALEEGIQCFFSDVFFLSFFCVYGNIY